MKFGNWFGVRRWLRQEWQAHLPPSQERLLTDPYYRLRSLDEVRLAAALGVRIDVNRACVDDWLRLPGLSIHQARSLVALTQAGVPFYCLEDVAAALNLPVQRLRPLEPILQFCYYEGSEVIHLLNVNRASVEQLTRVPAIDLYLARAIVQNRQRSGAYRTLAELQQRLALPGPLVAEIMHYLTF